MGAPLAVPGLWLGTRPHDGLYQSDLAAVAQRRLGVRAKDLLKWQLMLPDEIEAIAWLLAGAYVVGLGSAGLALDAGRLSPLAQEQVYGQ